MCCKVSDKSWLNSSQGELIGFAFEKSVEFIGYELLQKLFQSLLKRMELLSMTSHKCTRRRKRVQTSVPWANLIKMKTHSQLISMNMTSSKMVRNSILGVWAMQGKYPGYASRSELDSWCFSDAWQQNLITTTRTAILPIFSNTSQL